MDSQNSASIIGYISEAEGTVLVANEKGEIRTAQVGDPLFLNETVVNDSTANVVIELVNNQLLYLNSQQQIILNLELFGSTAAGNQSKDSKQENPADTSNTEPSASSETTDSDTPEPANDDGPEDSNAPIEDTFIQEVIISHDAEQPDTFRQSSQIESSDSVKVQQQPADPIEASTQINLKPEITNQSFNIDEGVDTDGSVVVGSVISRDPEGQDLSYAIISGNEDGKFTINPATGEITVTGDLDFETRNLYNLTVEATDAGNLSESATVTVSINNANEAPELQDQTYSIDENVITDGSQVVGTITGTDTDAGQTLTYTITAGNDDNRFAIDPNSGEITVVNGLDHESTDSYQLTVTATDDGIPSSSTSAQVTININDLNEAPTVTAPASASYTEGGTVNLFNTLTLDDPEGTLESATVQFTEYGKQLHTTEDQLNFTNQNGISGNYDSTNGVLTLTGTASVADYQTALRSITYSNLSDAPDTDSRILSVSVNDGFIESNVGSTTLSITAENDAPVITGAGELLGESIDTANVEGVAQNIRVTGWGTFTVGQRIELTFTNSEDTSEVYTVNYTISDTATWRIAPGLTAAIINDTPGIGSLVSVTSNNGQIVGSSYLNFVGFDNPNLPPYNLTSVLMDSAGNVIDSSITMINSTTIGSAGTAQVETLTIPSVLQAGQTVKLFINDFELSHTVTAGQATTDVRDALLSQFTNYDLSQAVSAVSSGADGITLTSEQPGEPFDAYGVTTSASDLFTLAVDENTSNGTVVGSVGAEDRDGDSDTLTYTLTDDAGGRFTINSSTGEITVAGALDHESAASHTVTVRVTDAQSAFSEQQITIQVNDSNDAPTVADQTLTTDEDTALLFTAADFSISDQDASDTHTVTIEAINGSGSLYQTPRPDLEFLFEETTGTTTTDDRNSTQGTLSNVTWSSEVGRGGFVTFDQNTDHITLSQPFDLGSEWTVATEFRNLRTDGNGYHSLTGSDSDVQIVVQSGTGEIGTWQDSVGFHSTGVSLNGISADWHSLVVVGQNGQTDFYLDNTLLGSASYQSTGEIDTVGNNSHGNDQAFAENLNNFRIYNVAHPPVTAPSVELSFDDSANPLTDSGNGVTGTVSGAQVVTDTERGSVLEFDNSSDTALLTTPHSLGSEWTISTQFKDLSSATWKTLARGSTHSHHIIIDSSGELGVFDGGSNSVGYTGTGFIGSGFDTSALDDNAWHSLTAVGKDGKTHFYIDGAYVGTSDFQITENVYSIGNYQSGSQPFATYLDDFTIVDTAQFPGTGTALPNGSLITAGDVINAEDLGDLRFIPNPDENGSNYASIDFKATDNNGADSTTETLTINVTAVSEAPTASDKTLSINEDNSHTFTAADFSFSDADAGDTLQSVTITQLPSAGTLTLSGANVTANQVIPTADIGNLVFTPVTHANGTGYTDIQFTVSDGALSSEPHTFTIDVTAVNDAPVLEATLDTVVSSEGIINTVTGSDQSEAVLTPMADGGYLAAWHSEESGSHAIKAQRYSVQATSRNVTIADHSFESVTLIDGEPVLNPAASPWSFSSTHSGIWNPTSGQITQEAPDGNNIGYATNDNETLSQTLSESFSNDTQYQLQVEIGNRSDTAGFANYEVRITAGGVVLASDGSVSPAEGQWQTLTLNLDGSTIPANSAAIGQPITIELVKISGPQIHFDNVRMTATSNELQPDGAEFQVDTTTLVDDQFVQHPQVATLENGNYAVAWEIFDPNSFAKTNMRIFAADGSEVKSEFEILTTSGSHYKPDVIALSNDRFLVTNVHSLDVKATILDENGNTVSTSTAGNVGGWQWGGPEATALNNGGFALVWRLSGTTADDSARIQFFDSNGNNTTSEISFGGAINDSDPHFEIDILSNGEVVTVYQSGENLFFQRWSDTGTAQGSAVQINTSVSPDINGVSEASIETLSDGGFFVVWRSTSQDSGASHGVYGRRFDASGNPLTDEIAINTTTAGNQFDPSVIELESGALQVVWTSNQDGNENIYGASIGLGGNQVLENAPYGTLVGRATATDVEDGTTLTYELVNDAGGRFAIDSTTGAIIVSSPSLLDHDSADAHTIRVRVTDSGGLTAEQDIVIQVWDTNEAPQDITLTLDAGVVSSTPEAQATWAFDNNYNNEAGGNTFSGATPTFVSGPNSRFSNAIEFDGSATDFNVPLDVSETAYTVSFWFKADNAGGLMQIQTAGASGHDRNIYLNADGTITSRIWTEESITSSVGEVYNDGQWHHVVHTFGTSISGQALYVDGTQVATGSKTSSDFTTQTQLRLGFSSTGGTHLDGAIAGLQVFDQAVTASQVADLLAGANGTNAIVDEDTTTATIIGTLTTTDPDDAADAFGQHSYNVSDNRFEISGNQLQLKAGQSLDYETEPTISVTVTATDDNGNGLSTSKTFTIQVRDSNEAPTVADQTFTINEDSQYNLKTSDFSIADQDAGDTHTVTITAINGSGTLMKQPRPDLELLFEDDNTATSAYDGRNDIRGNLTGVTWGTDAEKGGIVTFDQNSDRINLTQAYDLGSEWTITTEFRNLRSDGTTWQSLVEGNGDVQVLINQSTGEIGTWQNGVGFHGTGFTVSGLGNTWHSLTVIGRDGKTHFYLDDEYLGTANYQSTSSIETIGNNSVANSQAFADELNDFRIYNSANMPDLDLSQIAEANTPELSLTFTDQTDPVNDIANNIRGTATAGVEWQNDAQQGPVLRFDNENDYLTLDNDFAVGSEWTISTRFKNPIPLSSNGDQASLVRAGGGDSHVIINNSGELGVLDRLPSNTFHGSGYTITALDNNWHDLTAVGTNGKTYFYIDNQLVGISNFQATDAIDHIGGDDSTFMSPFAEFIDDFQIHDQAFFGDLGDVPPGSTTVNANDTIPADDLNDLIFVPDAHASGNTVASIDFKATDSGGLESSTETLTFNITPVTDAPVITLNNAAYSNLQLDTELITSGNMTSASGWNLSGNVGVASGVMRFSGGNTPNDGIAESHFTIHPDVNYNLSLDYRTSGLTTPQSGLIEIVDISTGNILASQTVNTNTGTFQTLSLNFAGIASGHATLRITDTSTATSGIDLHIDNISIQAAAVDNNHIPSGIGVFGQEDQPVAVNLSAATPDADGSETFAVELTGIPSGVGLSDGSNNITSTGAAIDVSAWNLSNLTFTSPANTSNDFTFTVSATATEAATGTPETTSQVINVHIQSINDIPVSADNTVTITEDNSHTFTTADFAFTDNDTGDSLQSITITSLPAAGTLELNTNPVTLNQVITAADISNLVFTPVAQASGTGYASFGFTVSDGTDSSTAQTLTLDVTPVTDTTTVTLNNNIIDTNVVQNGDVATTSEWTTSGAISLSNGRLQFGSGSANSDGIAEQGIYLNNGLDYSISLDYFRIGTALTESALIEVVDSATGSTLFSQSVSTNSASAQTLNANFTTTSAGFATLRISDTSSGSRPSTDLGIDNISLIPEAANNAGYTPTVSVPEDQPVPVELDIANPDTDGSETLAIQLTGIPSGIQLSDGTNNFTSTGAAIDVSSWNLNNLVLTPPANYDNDFTMTATATATETATGTQVVTNQAINIHIQDINAPPVITVLNPITDVDAAFSFSEGTGTTAADISGNSQDLSMSGSATWGTSRSGSGTAFEMNGTSGAGEISGVQTGGEMTIAAWVRFDSFTQSWSRVIDFGDGQASNNILVGHETTTGDLGFHVHDSGGTQHSLTVSNFFTTGEWVHMVATIDSTGLFTVYKNGEQAGTLQGGVPTEKVRNFNYVGKSNWSADGYLDGAIDDLAVISGALDATAVSNLYQASQLSDFVDANFVLDENSSNGTVVAQLSANDEEDGTNVTYTLVNNAGGRFAISSTGEITVADSSLLDHETTGSHTLRVRVTDSGGLTDEQDVVIQIADINEAPTAIVETSADNPNIPNLTSNNDQGFIVSASGEHSASYAAFRAFDGVDASSADNTGSWAVSGSTGWLQVDTGSPTAIWKYDLKAIGRSQGREPEDWQLQGSNDGINFDVIDTQSGINNWTVREVKEFELTTPAMYRYYRLNITDNNGDSFTGLDGFQIHQDITLTDQNTPLTLDVLANDIDQDDTDDVSNFSLDSVVIVDGSDNPVTGQGTATVVNNEIQFDPGSDFAYLAGGENATVNLRYTMSDDEGVTSTVTTTITVNGINDAPVINETMNTLDVNAAYTFTEGSGTTVADASGDNQPMTLSGTPTWVNGRTGAGTALELDGTNDFGTINGLQTGGAMTVAAWVQFDTTGNWARIIDFGNGAGNQNILLGSSTTDGLEIHVYNSSSTLIGQLTAPNSIQTNQWTHIAFTIDDAGVITLYVDGTSVGSATMTTNAPPDVMVRTSNLVGADNWNANQRLDGQIDDLVILNESLDATEINNLFQATEFTDLLLDIDEHSADNSVVGTVPATELDTSDTLTYTLLDDAGGRFSINSSNGEITIADGNLLDFDDNTSHKVRVRVTDNGNPSLSDEQDVTIVVNNINNTPVLSTSLDTATSTEQHINSITAGSQESSALTPMANGGFMAVWRDAGADQVKAQRYNYTQTRDVTIADHSFESVTYSDGGFSNNPGASAWTYTGTGGDIGTWNPTSGNITQQASDGSNVGYITPDNGVISQSLSENFSRLNSFQLQVDIGNRSDTAGFADYEVRITAGGVVLATGDSASPAEGQWETLTIDLDGSSIAEGSAAIGQPLTIELVKNSGPQMHFDNVRMSVTEPSLELNPLGDEFQINTTNPTSSQNILSPEVATLDNGNYAVVWQLIEPGSWIETRMRVFDANGNEVRAEFNLGTSHYATDVTALSDNRFATVSIDSSDSFNAKIHIFDASGNETSVVSAGSAGGWAYGSPDIEPLDNGGFVVSWRSNSTANDSASFRIYDASGSPTTNAISFGGSNPTNERATKIQELDNGELVTVYQSGDDLFFQRWSSTGTAIGSATAVNTTTADTQSQFNIETLPDGGFFVIWKSSGGQDGDGQGIVGRRFDASGTAVTDEIIINSTTAGEQFDPQLARLSNGALEALWTSDHTGDNEIFGSTIALGAGTGPNQVQENAMNGLLVGKAAVSDFDDPDTHTYTLVNDAGGRFAIDVNTGNISVADGTLLDHETNDSHTVRVRVTDNGGLFSEQDIVIQVQDVNEAPDVSGPMTITAPQNLATHTVSQAFLLTNASDVDDGDTLNVQDISINGITAHRHDFQNSFATGTGGSVAISGNTLTLTSGTDENVVLIDTTGGSSWDTNLHMDFTVTPTSGHSTRNAFIVFDYVDANNYKTIGSYDGDGTSAWEIEQWTNGVNSEIASYNSSDSSNINTPRHVEIDIINNRITMTVDGVEKIAHQFNENITDGQFGAMNRGNAVSTYTLNGTEWDIYPDNEHAVYDNNDGTWTIMPGEDLSGDLTLDYNVSDGELTTAATATLPVERTADITINLTQSSVTDDVLPVETTAQGNPLTVSSVNGQAIASSGTTSINGEFGTLDIAADGSWTYTPDSAYTSVDLDSNLIAEWNFDGNANDNAPSDSIADNGVLTGNAAYTNDSVSGSAVTLDGTGDYVQIATTTELGNYATSPSERTISLFFKLDPSNSKDGKQVLYEEGGSSHGFAIYLDNGKIYVGGWENSNTAYVNTDITYLDSDNWHHIALVMNDNANTLRGFLDGEIFGNAAGITVPAHTGTVAFGSPSEGNQAFDFHDLDDGVGTQFHGLIDEGRVYNRALTEAEVQIMGQLDQTETFTYEVSDGTHTSTSNLEINTLHTLDTINSADGSNGVNDTINGTLFSERLRGYDGNDTLNAGGGDDRIIGGIGDDILTGGSGGDVFKFNIGDIGTAAIPAQDTITDFNMSEGDSLDLSSILVDEENNDLTQYLSFDQADPANPIVEVRDTAGGDITQKITLQGVDLSLLGSTDAEIINSMLNSGNLSTD